MLDAWGAIEERAVLIEEDDLGFHGPNFKGTIAIFRSIIFL